MKPKAHVTWVFVAGELPPAVAASSPEEAKRRAAMHAQAEADFKAWHAKRRRQLRAELAELIMDEVLPIATARGLSLEDATAAGCRERPQLARMVSVLNADLEREAAELAARAAHLSKN